jgi:hypothetical protein
VLDLEIEIVFFSVRTKPDLFDDDLLGFGLDLLLLLLLFVLKL